MVKLAPHVLKSKRFLLLGCASASEFVLASHRQQILQYAKVQLALVPLQLCARVCTRCMEFGRSMDAEGVKFPHWDDGDGNGVLDTPHSVPPTADLRPSSMSWIATRTSRVTKEHPTPLIMPCADVRRFTRICERTVLGHHRHSSRRLRGLCDRTSCKRERSCSRPSCILFQRRG